MDDSVITQEWLDRRTRTGGLDMSAHLSPIPMICVLLAGPALGQNLLLNGSFEGATPAARTANWNGPIAIDSTVHPPAGPVPDGQHYGGTDVGGDSAQRFVHHNPVAVAPADIMLTGQWGGGVTCQITAGNCVNTVTRTFVMRVRDTDENGNIIAQTTLQRTSGPLDPDNTFGWVPFNITGTPNAALAVVQFGWEQGSG
jgi:hypothetical protein